ncbi:integron-associated HEPN domain-containing protein [Actinobacillus equuli]|uniref:integron-associated HEPN domain-containing protein n=1 Tax=Actinobacillus equuli TaxID=718 RepID=UPI00244222C4|nr:integron-associated HEPN domain-containing protein [Actinobacillus equuli]WGE46607.1 integron-associated HEPN domain-containing protein [Actinobacillus equuli subsp. haemolyticus]
MAEVKSITISEEDKFKLEKMYFYMQDIMMEMVSCHTLIHMLCDFHKGRSYSFFQEYEKITVSVPNNINPNVFMMNVRVPFHILVINIFKLGELIKQNQALLRKSLNDETKSKFEEFKKKYFTDDLIEYRNKYVAHHRDNKKDDFLNYNELINFLAKILGEADPKQIDWDSFLNYSDNFYTTDSSKKSSTICQIIYDLHIEMQAILGRKLNRKLAN